MKKLFTILLLVTCFVIAKDTTDVHLKDTLVTKSVNENTFWNYNFLQTFISVLAGSILTLIGVMFSNRHQRKVTQYNINAETYRSAIIEIRGYQSELLESVKSLERFVVEFNFMKDKIEDVNERLTEEDITTEEMQKYRFNFASEVREFGIKTVDLVNVTSILANKMVLNKYIKLQHYDSVIDFVKWYEAKHNYIIDNTLPNDIKILIDNSKDKTGNENSDVDVLTIIDKILSLKCDCLINDLQETIDSLDKHLFTLTKKT